MINDDGAPSNFEASQELSPPPVTSATNSKSRKMRLQKSKNRQRSAASGNGASNDDSTSLGDIAPNVGVCSDEDNDVSSSDESCVATSLVRKVKRRSHLSNTDHEIVRLIGQHLTNIGLKTSADVLMQEAGTVHTYRTFRLPNRTFRFRTFTILLLQ